MLFALLPPEWEAQEVYDNHEVMMLHGQRCCFFSNPACERCAILDLCPSGQARMREDRSVSSPDRDRGAPHGSASRFRESR
jgi:endonuclease-3